jgi:nucleoside-diphosphate-sugar epimerase
MKQVFLTGGIGYIGRRLITLLLEKGYNIKALVRKGSENKLPKSCSYVIGDPFNASTFSNDIPASATFVQLLGVSHPGHQRKNSLR